MRATANSRGWRSERFTKFRAFQGYLLVELSGRYTVSKSTLGRNLDVIPLLKRLILDRSWIFERLEGRSELILYAIPKGVADAVRVEGGDGHGVDFIVNEAAGGAVDGRVEAKGEDVLVVGDEDAGVDDGAPGS